MRPVLSRAFLLVSGLVGSHLLLRWLMVWHGLRGYALALAAAPEEECRSGR